MSRFSIEGSDVGVATELRGFWVPSVSTDALSGFHVPVLERELCELCDCTLCLFFLLDALDLACCFLTISGTPSHFEFTLGTLSGSFLVVKLLGVEPRPDGDDGGPFSAACLRWAWAYCLNASLEGSFRERKPNTPVFFFFFDDRASSEEATLGAVEARLDGVRLAVSIDGVQLEGEELMDGTGRGSSGSRG